MGKVLQSRVIIWLLAFRFGACQCSLREAPASPEHPAASACLRMMQFQCRVLANAVVRRSASCYIQ